MEERCYRNEYKHIISQAARASLSARLTRILEMDENSKGKPYVIRSLYFDSLYDEALKEKIDGAPSREKFRIRYYNQDLSFIRLEKKVKEGTKGYKLSARLTRDEAESIIKGDFEFLKDKEDRLLLDFYVKSRTKFLKPKSVIIYEREAYTFKPGNVRVTLDCNIRTSRDVTDFFSSDLPLMEDGECKCVLEVKFDNFLPELIRDLVQVNETMSTSNSKYMTGRLMWG